MRTLLIQKFRQLFPQAYDRNDPTQRAPTSEELDVLSRHRKEPSSGDGSSADEGVPGKNSGWAGVGPPMQVGVSYTSRDCCDGQGLASPGRWPVERRRYPSSRAWEKVKRSFTQFAEARCTTELLMALAVGQMEDCPFDSSEVRSLKERIVADLKQEGLGLGRHGFLVCSSGRPKIRR